MPTYHNNCKGYKLFSLWRLQVELWICPPYEYIESHSHPDIESVVVLLAGSLFGTRNGKSRNLKQFKPYLIRSTDLHSAYVDANTTVFLNFQWWRHSKPTSASVNFVKSI